MTIEMENGLGREHPEEEGNEVIAAVGVEAGAEVAAVVEVAGKGLNSNFDQSQFE